MESDVEDVLELCYAADRMKVEIPCYAAIDINVFPRVPLEEVNGSIACDKVLSKLSSEAEDVLKGIVEEARILSCDSAAEIHDKMSSDMENRIRREIKKLCEEMKGVRKMISEVGVCEG